MRHPAKKDDRLLSADFATYRNGVQAFWTSPLAMPNPALIAQGRTGIGVNLPRSGQRRRTPRGNPGFVIATGHTAGKNRDRNRIGHS